MAQGQNPQALCYLQALWADEVTLNSSDFALEGDAHFSTAKAGVVELESDHDGGDSRPNSTDSEFNSVCTVPRHRQK